MSAREIQADINELRAVEYAVASNQGTYGAAEAGRKVGCGDPQFADRFIYETVGGNRRATGPDEADMPGRMIWWSTNPELERDRAELSVLYEQLEARA